MSSNPTSLKIAFDAKRLFHNREGLGQYARTLVSGIQEAYPQHTYCLCTPSTSEDYPYFLDESRFKVIKPSSKSRKLWRQIGVVEVLKKENVDIYFGLSNELPRGLSKSGIKSVVSIHDLLYKVFPQQFSMADRMIYNMKFKHAVNEADKIVVTSQHTQQDLERLLSADRNKIELIYQSSFRTEEVLEVPLSSRKHFLFVGTINERKNLKLVVEAYNRLSEEDRRPIIVVGKGKKYRKEVKELIKQYGLDKYFKFLGNVSDNHLRGLYKNAIALLFPSKYEGFGRPVIESLALGTPVIAMKTSSIPEVVGKHGIIIEYDRTDSLIEAMRKITNPKVAEELLEGRQAHLKAFQKEEHITLIMNMLENLQVG